jgi:hypothetical protein
MSFRFSKGDYVAQIFAYEEDVLRLLQNVQLHVVAGNALYGAVFLCKYSASPSAIEKCAIMAASYKNRSDGPHLDHDLGNIGTASAVRHPPLSGDLTLTLLNIDTTWRFDKFENRLASPQLSWPAIRKFYIPGTFVERDLILKDVQCRSEARSIPRKSQYARVERYR